MLKIDITKINYYDKQHLYVCHMHVDHALLTAFCFLTMQFAEFIFALKDVLYECTDMSESIIIKLMFYHCLVAKVNHYSYYANFCLKSTQFIHVREVRDN